MSEPADETPIKHVINIACTERSHETRSVRICAFGDWSGDAWGRSSADESDQPWHALGHWISEDAPRLPRTAAVQPATVLHGVATDVGGREGRTSHPTWGEIDWMMTFLKRNGMSFETLEMEGPRASEPFADESERRKVAAIVERVERRASAEAEEPAAEKRGPKRLTYDLRCPLCDLHLSVRAEKLHPFLDALAPHCTPIKDEALRKLAPLTDTDDGFYARAGLLTPPAGPIAAFTLSLSALAARVGAH